jgi:YD repeat-containing protein
VEPEGEDGLYHLTEYLNEHKENTIYRYGGESYLEGNLLTEITEPSGNVTKLAYNSDYQITKIERIPSGQKTGPTTTYTYYELGKAPAPCTSTQRETEVAESGTEKHTIYCANVLDEVERVAHTWSSAEIVAVCSEYNPETASAEINEECEATTYGPSSVTETPGGGVAAHYTLSEGEVLYNTPPKGFEPLKASNAELEEYNIPTAPPTGTPEHEAWETMMKKLHFTEPEPTMVEVHTLSAAGSEVPSQTWSGYLADSESQSDTQVSGKFIVPYAKKEQGCPNATMSAWVGLGGLGEGSPLSQDGFNVVAGAKTDPVWWEVLPATETFIKKVVATPGGEFLATTHATGLHSRRCSISRVIPPRAG